MFFFSGDICAESTVKKMDSAPLWEEYSKQRKSQVQSLLAQCAWKGHQSKREALTWGSGKQREARENLSAVLWPGQDKTGMY